MNADLDLSKWAVVAPKDFTGLGRMAEDMKAVLGIGYHLVIPSERLNNQPLNIDNEILLTQLNTEMYILEYLT